MRFDFRHQSDTNAVPMTAIPCEPQAPKAGAGARANRLRHPSLQLLQAVMRLAGPSAELICQAERPWASITFSGTRHTISLLFAGAKAEADAQAFVDALPEHEFTIKNQLVADAAITEINHLTLPDRKVMVEADLLLLEDI
jgi:hypothetical protein